MLRNKFMHFRGTFKRKLSSEAHKKIMKSCLAPTKADRDLVSFQHPRDNLYTHDFISSEIQKFYLINEGCHRCNLLCKHLQDPRLYFDKLS